MTLNEFCDLFLFECRTKYREYEIIIAGHPGEAGTILHENSIVINDVENKIIILC